MDLISTAKYSKNVETLVKTLQSYSNLSRQLFNIFKNLKQNAYLHFFCKACVEKNMLVPTILKPGANPIKLFTP